MHAGYSNLPIFISSELAAKGTVAFIVPENATSYDMRYRNFVTIHIENKKMCITLSKKVMNTFFYVLMIIVTIISIINKLIHNKLKILGILLINLSITGLNV